MSYPTLINELLCVIVLIVEKGPRTETFYYFVNFARDKLKKSVTVHYLYCIRMWLILCMWIIIYMWIILYVYVDKYYICR